MITSNPQPSHGRIPLRWILIGILILVSLVAVGYFQIQEVLREALHRVQELGRWGAVLFVTIYVVSTVLFIPGSALTLGAGAIFGVLWGSVYVSIGATLGATLAFLVGRHLARESIARRIEGDARFAAMDQAVEKEGWKIVGLTRLSPVFPFTLLNYAFGITRVKLSHYILASWAGMIPGTVMYVYFGSLAKAAANDGHDGARTTGQWLLYGSGLIATVVVTIYVTRIARKALSEKIVT